MIPIRDQIQSKSYPVVTRGIIGVNILVFILQLMQGENIERFIYMYGLVPARYSVPEVAAHFSSGEQVFALFSFMFLHGGFLHILGNMWFLHIFGDNVEDRMGHGRFLLFYLLCGVAATIAQLFATSYADLNIPNLGASGAIAGVLASYLVLFPRQRVRVVLIAWVIPLPALLVIGGWFLLQVLYQMNYTSDGVAYMAHIGGFIAGLLLTFVFRKKNLPPRLPYSRPYQQ